MTRFLLDARFQRNIKLTVCFGSVNPLKLMGNHAKQTNSLLYKELSEQIPPLSKRIGFHHSCAIPYQESFKAANASRLDIHSRISKEPQTDRREKSRGTRLAVKRGQLPTTNNLKMVELLLVRSESRKMNLLTTKYEVEGSTKPERQEE